MHVYVGKDFEDDGVKKERPPDRVESFLAIQPKGLLCYKAALKTNDLVRVIIVSPSFSLPLQSIPPPSKVSSLRRPSRKLYQIKEMR